MHMIEKSALQTLLSIEINTQGKRLKIEGVADFF